MHNDSVDVELHTFYSPRIRSVVKQAIKFMESTPIHSMPPLGNFSGVGVYALYYKGDFEHYYRISARNKDRCVLPIYVGKAVPPGWRAARASITGVTHSLRGRLQEHARSIEQTDNIEVQDFLCRFIILEGIESDLISSVEAQMIRRHKPLWNAVVDGFGNHDPGSGRYNQARSEWDVLHPGRSWAMRLTGKSPILSEILRRIAET